MERKNGGKILKKENKRIVIGWWEGNNLKGNLQSYYHMPMEQHTVANT